MGNFYTKCKLDNEKNAKTFGEIASKNIIANCKDVLILNASFQETLFLLIHVLTYFNFGMQKSSFKRYEISHVYRRAIGHSPPNPCLQVLCSVTTFPILPFLVSL